MTDAHSDLLSASTGRAGKSRSRKRAARAAIGAALTILLGAGCAAGDPVAPPEAVREWGTVEDFDQPLAVFEHVFWEPRDTTATREHLRELDLSGKRVMEIGTGSGLLSLCAINAGAASVLATDINPHAVLNARYNAERLGLAERLEVRHVREEQSEAFAVLEPG